MVAITLVITLDMMMMIVIETVTQKFEISMI